MPPTCVARLAGQCHHRPFGQKSLLRTSRGSPALENSRLTSRPGRTAGARPAVEVVLGFPYGCDQDAAERPGPVPGPREVVTETAAAGICGTGTHVPGGEFEGTVFPLVPGHEATGTVTAPVATVFRLRPDTDVFERASRCADRAAGRSTGLAGKSCALGHFRRKDEPIRARIRVLSIMLPVLDVSARRRLSKARVEGHE
jgi:Alcohol dehydrogenase GroES-like domain